MNGTVVECRKADAEAVLFRFYILDAPSPSSLAAYVKDLQRQKVRHLIRVCGPTYNSEVVEKSGIAVHGWPFDDGAPPTQAVLESWLSLLESEKGKDPPTTIAVHCVAGLGRAPILVAIALVEYAGMAPLDAIGYVRERRKGAINQVQLNWLMRYKPRTSAGAQASHRESVCGCTAM